jgi:hypothetical protein
VNEAASHAEQSFRISRDLEQQARSLFGKKADAIQAQLVIDAEKEIDKRDDHAPTHNVWVASYALARATMMLSWAFSEVQRLELEAIGQEPLFACDPDEADQ